MVDPGRVRRLLEALSAYRDRLAPLRDLPSADYEGDAAFAGRYLVQASAQACIDIANHVIASSGWRAPADFRDAFTVLEQHAALDGELAERMRELAGMRNRLVHIYEEVDDRIVHESLPQGLEDLSSYAQAIARLLDAGGPDEG
ncbi:MAG: type VII toxin-antitoxin system HepT family RNase toxin [Solirubrobacteraceae bacterium]